MTIIVTREYPDGFRLVKVHDGIPINDKVYGTQKEAYGDARRTYPSGRKMVLGYKVPSTVTV